jgi:leucyl-tRNA synthetase
MSAELWQELGNSTSIEEAGWPQWDESFIKSDTRTIIVQVNGKLRGSLEVAADVPEEEVTQAALGEENVKKFLEGKSVAKTIYVAGRLVNFVVS